MASSTGANGYTPQSLLMDRKALKKHLENGSPILLHSDPFQPSPFSIRRGSEPPSSAFSFATPIIFDTPNLLSKDDAYDVLEQKGKKASNTPKAGQAPQSEARLLLDPLGHSKSIRAQRTQDARTNSTDPNHAEVPNPYFNHHYNEPTEVYGNNVQKHSFDDLEGQGMGSLIERVHNVSQREERPQKRQKVETFEDESEKKAIHGGGGKGGEIGEYLKQKKKEGIEESGAVSSVVDLTGGEKILLQEKTLTTNTW